MLKLFFKSLTIFILLNATESYTRTPIDTTKLNYGFISPVEIPISLSGNFGELRPGHFHAGLDIRTQGKEGLKVKSIYNGYVSRIAISLGGYGKVVYVTHSNGFTSVYAHLSRFNNELEQFVKDYQYQNKTFELELYPEENSFKINQGDRIGWSGNTGGSGGPHLHFEVRNTQSEKPINPLHFGFKVKDNISPTLKNLSIFPLNDNSSVDNKGKRKTYKLIKSGNKYVLSGNVIPIIKGKIGFGIETLDKTNNSTFSCGVYSIELLKVEKRVYFHVMDSISYSETRYINAHVDYYQWKKDRKRIQRSYLLEGNKLSIYKDLVNNGQLFFTDSSVHQMKYRIKDFEGNESVLIFKVKAKQREHDLIIKKEPTRVLVYDFENKYDDDELKITIPKTCLYENTPLFISKENAIGRCVTPRYHINKLYDPLQDYISVSININQIPKKLHPKLIMVSLNSKSEILAPEGGIIDSNWISTKTRSFGPYTVMVDSISPTVKAKLAINGLTFSSNSVLRFYIKDNISGIKKYEAFVDNEWHLIEYQRNKKSAFLKLDKILKTGTKRKLRIEITDNVGNKTKKDYWFIY